MGKKAVKVYFYMIGVIISILLAILTFVGLYGGDDTPINNANSALLCYALPLLVVLNAIMAVLWIFFRRPYGIINIITLACSWNYIGTIYQFGGEPKGTNKPGLTIASYNVRGFNKEVNGLISNDIKEIMKRNKVDVLCIQEFIDNKDEDGTTVINKYKSDFPYHVSHKGDMIIFSKYPILNSKNMPFEYSNNSALWADIKVNDKTIRVFNVHMETTGINRTMRMIAKAQIPVQNEDKMHALLGNYAFGMQARAGQSILIANEKRESPHPIILCGDFNDVPYSFTYNTLKGNLKDGFKEAGSGFMFTYRGAKNIMRIDYIFNDPSLKVERYYTTELPYSDHNPVFMRATF